MAVKRRVIWLSDDEWFLIRTMAKDRDETVSELIRSMWETAAIAHPATAEEIEVDYALMREQRYDERPLRAVPKSRT